MDLVLNFHPQAFVLVLTRTIAFVGVVSLFGGQTVPMRIRVMLAFVLSLIFVPLLPFERIEQAKLIVTLPQILCAMLGEVLFGVGLGLVSDIFIVGAVMAGALISESSSLMMAQMLDPVDGVSDMIISQMLKMLVVLLALAANAHLVLLKFFSQSLLHTAQPLWGIDGNLLDILLTLGTDMFQWGVRIALPVICAVLVVDVCMALTVRLAPDFNVLFLSLPIRIAVALGIFGLMLRFGAGVFDRLVNAMVQSCARVCL